MMISSSQWQKNKCILMIFFKLKISEYISKYFLFNFLSVSAILSLLIFGNQLFIVFYQSLNKGFFTSEILDLVFFKFLRDMPFLLGFALVLTIIITLNKLYKSSEAIIIESAGFSQIGFFKLLSPWILIVISIISFLALHSAPVSKQKIEDIRENARLRPNYFFLKEQNFQNFDGEEITFYSQEVDSLNSETNHESLKGIFLFFHKTDKLIMAKHGEKFLNFDNGESILRLFDGILYENLQGESNLKLTKFDTYDVNTVTTKKVKKSQLMELEGVSTFELFDYNVKEKNVELIYRLSIPISILILSMLSVLFAKTKPRSKKNFAIGFGVASFILYYNLILIGKKYSLETLQYDYLMQILPHFFFLLILILLNLNYKKHKF